ncbi:hypothetical protein BRPE64_DCDS07890 (plasmid) [Caballeronia insecticola]|uniref:Uncharacterized protein n=1 Tax=Caballeronia insecticola TaxID=758793 RepID=R4X0L2_9BURK|nr:hypothetical protein BRPE64_DCDS07890 [Caballeronia insecticola]
MQLRHAHCRAPFAKASLLPVFIRSQALAILMPDAAMSAA